MASGVPPSPPPGNRLWRAQALRGRLAQDRAALARWVPRLRRAFHAVERLQIVVARSEKRLAALEGS